MCVCVCVIVSLMSRTMRSDEEEETLQEIIDLYFWFGCETNSNRGTAHSEAATGFGDCLLLPLLAIAIQH